MLATGNLLLVQRASEGGTTEIATRITFNKNNEILFSRKLTIYKDSTVKVEVIYGFYKKLYITSFISKKLTVLLIQRYPSKYNNS